MFPSEAFAHAWRTVSRSKRVLALAGLVDLVVCLPPALYVLRHVHGASAHRPDALELAKRFDPDFMSDLRNHSPGFDDDLTALCVGSLAIFFLVRPFVVGGFVGVATTRRRVRLAHFVKEAGALYWKYLRLAILACVAAYLLSIAAKPLLAQVEEWARLSSEPTAVRYRLVTNLVVFGAFSIVAMVFEYARVGLRIDRAPGVLAELGRAALFVLQHPARTSTMFVAALAAEVGAVLAFGWLLQIADGGYFTTSAIVLVLMQVVVTLREAARLFHVAGAWHIRSSEAGDERREPAVVVPEREESDVLRAPLPWNVR